MQCLDHGQRAVRSPMRLRDCSYGSRGPASLQDHGGDGGGGVVEEVDGKGDDGYDDENSVSWSEEYALSSYSGTGGSSDSGDGWSGDDDTRTSSSSGSGGPADDRKGSGDEGGGKKGKWLKSLMTLVDRLDDRKCRDGRRSPRPVKSILRPPTTYKYVIGMSGLPTKVAVYPKRT